MAVGVWGDLFLVSHLLLEVCWQCDISWLVASLPNLYLHFHIYVCMSTFKFPLFSLSHVSLRLRDRMQVSCIAGRFFTI